MKRNEYIGILAEVLADMDAESRNEILEEFEHHFDEGIRSGMSEEEISEELGDPREAAEGITELSGKGELSLKNILSELASVFRSAGRSGDSEPETVCGSHDGHCGNVVIHTDHASADMTISTGDRFEYVFRKGINLFGTNNCRVDHEVRDDTFFLNISDGHGDLELTVPCCCDMMEIRNTSGDIMIRDINLVSADIKSGSGDIRLEQTDTEKLRILVRSGDVNLVNVNALRSEIKLSSGDLEMNCCSGNAEIETVSGDIDISAHTGERIVISGRSGDIELETDAPEIEVSSVSGDIEIGTPNRIAHIEVHSVSGDIDLSLKDPEWSAEFSTVSGDLKNKTGKPDYRAGKTLRIGEGQINVIASSVSGDIKADTY
ncbi:MAG: DUF4097 family beta strand repeat-containing protein [Solobacterium sp.]|nr:DUF4097 family beta strand repeat-containing protein [Solobacterium sp.]